MAEAAGDSTRAAGPCPWGAILAGGSGSRFWPWSREATPKQLLALDGATTLLETTVRRMLRVVAPERLLVITREDLREASCALLAGLLPGANVVGEPEPKDTLPAVVLAAALVRARAPGGCGPAAMLVASCDHLITGRAEFRRNLEAAAALAAGTSRLVTIGVRPLGPETGYGYIRPGRHLPGIPGAGPASAREVAAFVEKPALEQAKLLVAQGCLWNAGIFAWRPDTLLAAVVRRVRGASTAIAGLEQGGAAAAAAAYAALPRVSIDRAVLEHERGIAVVEAEFGWLDLGTWNGAARTMARDAAGNATAGPVLALGGRDNVVRAQQGKPVVVAGVDGLLVVDMPDVLLVTRLDQDQRIREVRAEVRRAGWSRLL